MESSRTDHHVSENPIMRTRHVRPTLLRHWTLESLDSRCLPSVTNPAKGIDPIAADDFQPIQDDSSSPLPEAQSLVAANHRSPSRANAFLDTDLGADEAGEATLQDTRLGKPWGIGLSPTGGAFWISDN